MKTTTFLILFYYVLLLSFVCVIRNVSFNYAGVWFEEGEFLHSYLFSSLYFLNYQKLKRVIHLVWIQMIIRVQIESKGHVSLILIFFFYLFEIENDETDTKLSCYYNKNIIFNFAKNLRNMFQYFLQVRIVAVVVWRRIMYVSSSCY